MISKRNRKFISFFEKNDDIKTDPKDRTSWILKK